MGLVLDLELMSPVLYNIHVSIVLLFSFIFYKKRFQCKFEKFLKFLENDPVFFLTRNVNFTSFLDWHHNVKCVLQNTTSTWAYLICKLFIKIVPLYWIIIIIINTIVMFSRTYCIQLPPPQKKILNIQNYENFNFILH